MPGKCCDLCICQTVLGQRIGKLSNPPAVSRPNYRLKAQQRSVITKLGRSKTRSTSQQAQSTCKSNPAEDYLVHGAGLRSGALRLIVHPHTRSATHSRVTHQYAWYRPNAARKRRGQQTDSPMRPLTRPPVASIMLTISTLSAQAT